MNTSIIGLFLDTNSELRTNDSFRMKLDPDHHIGTTVLEEIPSLDMIQSFPLDYIHLICMGVVRKILNLMVNGRPGPHKLSGQKIQSISILLVQLSSETSFEFSRKARSRDQAKIALQGLISPHNFRSSSRVSALLHPFLKKIMPTHEFLQGYFGQSAGPCPGG